MPTVTPDLAPLQTVAAHLRRSAVPFALGGSGLLYSLGLVEQVRDWDLTTDAPLEVVTEALAGLPWELAPHGDGRYATDYRLTIRSGDRDVDLMGRFRIRTEHGICHLPTIAVDMWQGVPVGSPEVWAVAYLLMERAAKAALLDRYLHRHGARQTAIDRLLQEPLPPAVRETIATWPITIR